MRNRTRRVGAVLMAAGMAGLLLGSLAVGAQASSTLSHDYEGNATHCGDLDKANPAQGTSGITLADLPTTEGTYDVSSDDGLFEATITVDGEDKAYSIEVTKGLLLHFVVKGGDNYRVYDFAGVPNDSETGMVAPDNGGGNTPTISHGFLCYGEEQTTTTSEDTTTTTEEETTTSTTAAVSQTTVVQTPTTVGAQVEGTVLAKSTPTTAAAKVLGEQLAATGAFSDLLTALSGFALLLGGLTLAVSAVPARSRLDA